MTMIREGWSDPGRWNAGMRKKEEKSGVYQEAIKKASVWRTGAQGGVFDGTAEMPVAGDLQTLVSTLDQRPDVRFRSRCRRLKAGLE